MPVHPVRHQRPRGFRLPGGLLALPLLLALLPAGPSPAASALLESVKSNPARARSLCDRFKEFNAQGKSATSGEAVAWVASTQSLSKEDAEVLSTYVIGLHCPDVR